jgi:hypothetical protein
MRAVVAEYLIYWQANKKPGSGAQLTRAKVVGGTGEVRLRRAPHPAGGGAALWAL